MPLPKAKLKNLYIKEIAGVYRGAQGRQPAVILKRRSASTTTLFSRVVNKAAVTDEVDGHQHTIDLDDPADSYCDSYSTSYQTAAGADDGHSHAWTYDPATGAVTIAADSGHTHAVSDVVPPDVIAAAAVREAAEKQRRAAGVAAAVLGGEAGSTATITVAVEPSTPVEMSAVVESLTDAGRAALLKILRATDETRARVLPPSTPTPTVKSQEQVMADAKDDQIAALTKTVARLEQLATLTDAQRAHHGTLRGQDADVFLAKSQLERDAVVTAVAKAAADADAPIYKTASGIEIRKSDGIVALQLAKAADAAAVVQTAQAEQLAIAKAATETAAIEKRAAADLSHFAKALPVHVAIVRAIDTIPDEAVRKEALESMRGANAAMVLLSKSIGANPGDAPAAGSPRAAFDTARVSFAKAKFKTESPTESQIRQVTGEFIKTAAGSELYADLSTPAQA